MLGRSKRPKIIHICDRSALIHKFYYLLPYFGQAIHLSDADNSSFVLHERFTLRSLTAFNLWDLRSCLRHHGGRQQEAKHVSGHVLAAG